MGRGAARRGRLGDRLDVHAFLDYLQYVPWYKDQLAHRESIPPRTAEYGELDAPLHPRLVEALAEQGIDALYTHQAEAINHVRRGENVIVATPAASGKSLCYQLPVVEALMEDRSACALYVFPTKALSQDQSDSLTSLTASFRATRHAVYDGDTPRQDRGAIRRTSRVVITNPDMLHVGILPNHRAWYRLLRNLRYVVIDEAHVFRGVFGSHFANVLRRLRRLCRRFGSDPQFVMCSATVANPAEHAQRLTGLPFRVVNRDGSSYGGKDFLFWNPPVLDYAEGSRLSTNTETARIFAELLRRRVRTLAFVKSRQLAELVHLHTRRQLEETDPAIVDRVSPYRGGYMPEERRRIERELYDGRLLGVATTNALELGIDVGDLDATLLNGYPGSIASAWQQAARSGRSGDRSLSVLVALDDPLDQYLMRHPEAFFGRPHERALTSPENEYILKPHLLCAAYEAPLDHGRHRVLRPRPADVRRRVAGQRASQRDRGPLAPVARNVLSRRVGQHTIGLLQHLHPGRRPDRPDSGDPRRIGRLSPVASGRHLHPPGRAVPRQVPRPGRPHRLCLQGGRSVLHPGARPSRTRGCGTCSGGSTPATRACTWERCGCRPPSSASFDGPT